VAKLEEAQAKLWAQEYEQAIELANLAEQAARLASQEAIRKTNEKQRQVEWQRRQQQTAQLNELLDKAGGLALQVLRQVTR
jgi:hypothetical protein